MRQGRDTTSVRDSRERIHAFGASCLASSCFKWFTSPFGEFLGKKRLFWGLTVIAYPTSYNFHNMWNRYINRQKTILNACALLGKKGNSECPTGIEPMTFQISSWNAMETRVVSEVAQVSLAQSSTGHPCTRSHRCPISKVTQVSHTSVVEPSNRYSGR